MKKILMLTAAALILQVTPVLAGHHEGEGSGDHKSKMFEKHDANGDGVISEAEFLAQAKEKFAKMDTDGNGTVTKEEVKAAREEMKGKWKEKREERKGSSTEKSPE